jgi:outer membrane protein TolC
MIVPRSLTGLAFAASLCGAGFAQDPGLTCADVERIALQDHPILSERAMEVDKAQEKVRDLDMGVILPRFEIETGMGPAPGIRQVVRDTLQRYNRADPYYNSGREFDFSEWGPFFGIQARVVQPLNIARYRAGRRAATLRVRVSEAELKKERLDVSEEAQTICMQRLYALTMRRELEAARKDLDRAQKKLSDRLDEGDEAVSQTDVLQLKAGRFALDQGVNEAALGVERSGLGLRFLLARPDGDSAAALADSVLTLRGEELPPLDSLKLAALRNHPDLTRLRNGLAARQEMLKVAQGEIGPDIFLFGTFEYSKAWSSDRQSGGGDPFARDPLNELTGVAGLGMRVRLNFWNSYQTYRRERLSLRQLERTEVYAARGVLLRVEDAYLRALKARADAEAAQNALRAAEAWLKGAAMRYDLDPDEASGLTAPFRQSVTAKRDFYKAVLEYNLAVAALFKSVGWTLSDYLGTLHATGPVPAEATEP